MKNDSGIKSATGLTGSGSRDWIVQRISGVLLAIYSVVMIGFFLTHSQVDYVQWVGFMMSLPMRLFSLVVIIALAGHAWVGMWTVFTDYITSKKLGPSAGIFRLLLQAAMIIAILVYVFWGIMIFWGLGIATNV